MKHYRIHTPYNNSSLPRFFLKDLCFAKHVNDLRMRNRLIIQRFFDVSSGYRTRLPILHVKFRFFFCISKADSSYFLIIFPIQYEVKYMNEIFYADLIRINMELLRSFCDNRSSVFKYLLYTLCLVKNNFSSSHYWFRTKLIQRHLKYKIVCI